MHADRTNRSALTVFGLLVLLAGAAAGATSLGWFGHQIARKPLFHNFISTYIGHNGSWVWAAAAALGLLVALICLRWILALLISTDRAGDIAVAGAKGGGSTVIRPGAVSAALADEIVTYHGVDSAKARIVGDGSDPQVVLTVTLAQSADLAQLRRRVEAEALAHLRQALGRPELAVRLDIEVSRHVPPRAS